MKTPNMAQIASTTTYEWPPGPVMTTDEVAQVLRVSGDTVRRWAASGLLPLVATPTMTHRKHYRFPTAGIRAMVEGDNAA